MQTQSGQDAFDFIKLDIEGAETLILQESASRTVLCQARCIFVELHERLTPGAESAFSEFMQHGCNATSNVTFEQADGSGEYLVACRHDVMAAALTSRVQSF
jgi:hypothetical protein